MRQKGFTLIELMIVIAIIGILATLAIPTYRDYTVRARVMEGINLSSQAQTAVNESVTANDSFPESQGATGYVTPKPTENVSSVTIGKNGIITITYTEAAGNGTILFTPSISADGRVSWDCKEGSLASKYRPTVCRK